MSNFAAMIEEAVRLDCQMRWWVIPENSIKIAADLFIPIAIADARMENAGRAFSFTGRAAGVNTRQRLRYHRSGNGAH